MSAKVVVPWTLACMLPLSLALRCADIGQCEYDPEVYANAQDKGEVISVCNLLNKSIHCLEISLADCERSSDFPVETLKQAKQVLETHTQQVQAECPDYSESIQARPHADNIHSNGGRDHTSSPVIGPTCSEIPTCYLDLRHFKVALRDDRLAEACSLINPSVTCLKLAIKDCQDSHTINSQDVVNASLSLAATEKLLEKYCGSSTKEESNPALQTSADQQKSTQDNLMKTPAPRTHQSGNSSAPVTSTHTKNLATTTDHIWVLSYTLCVACYFIGT